MEQEAEQMATRTRRTQEERKAETRSALIDGAIATVFRLGYGGATTPIIAEEAGVSRGALTHHFESRADLMASVVTCVYERELDHYATLTAGSDRGSRLSDWPELLWEVLSKPSGLAVLEILQATRSDPDLAVRVKPVQVAIEQASLDAVKVRFGGDDRTRHAIVRLLVWAVRGLTIERVLVSNPEVVRDSIDMLRVLFERFAPDGGMDGFVLE